MSRSSLPAKRLKYTYIDYLAEMIGNAHYSEDQFFSELDNVLSNNPELVNGQDKDGNTMIHLCFLHGKDRHLQAIISQAESKGITLQMPNNDEKQSPAELAPVNDKTISLIKLLANHYQRKSLEELEEAIENPNLLNLIDEAIDQELLISINERLTIEQKALNHAQKQGYVNVEQAISKKQDESLAKELGITLEEYHDKKDYLNSLSDEKLLRHIKKGLPESKVKTSKSETLAPTIITTKDL